MLYIREFIIRILYLFISFIISFLFFYNFKNYILFIILSKLVFIKNSYLQYFETCFIFKSPDQLLDVYIYLCLIFSIYFFLPFFIWNIFCFIFPIIQIKYIIIIRKLIFFIVIFYVLNYGLSLKFFPIFWSIFEYINLSVLQKSTINIEYEPNLKNYLISLYQFLKFFNYFIFIFCCYNYYLISITYNNYINNKFLDYLSIFLIILYIITTGFSILNFLMFLFFFFFYLSFKKIIDFILLYKYIFYRILNKN